MTDNERAFEPAKFLTKVSGQDYLEVKWRIVWFRDIHPEGSIESVLVSHAGNEAIFKATVSWPTETGMVQCTDYGTEASDDFGDYVEKASTKAIGRALGLAGFGTQFSLDHEFGADQQRVVDSPVNIRGAGQQRGSGGPARTEPTPRQLKYVHVVAKEVGLTHDELQERCEQQFGSPVEMLSRRDISSLIEQLQAERGPDFPEAESDTQDASSPSDSADTTRDPTTDHATVNAFRRRIEGATTGDELRAIKDDIAATFTDLPADHMVAVAYKNRVHQLRKAKQPAPALT